MNIDRRRQLKYYRKNMPKEVVNMLYGGGYTPLLYWVKLEDDFWNQRI